MAIHRVACMTGDNNKSVSRSVGGGAGFGPMTCSGGICAFELAYSSSFSSLLARVRVDC